jgi:hypothetical protein
MNETVPEALELISLQAEADVKAEAADVVMQWFYRCWDLSKTGRCRPYYPECTEGLLWIRDKDGYILIRKPDHPYAMASGYVREHRLVMEDEIGRYLRPGEVVHHINGIRDDNRIENLVLYESNAAHKRVEMRGNTYAKGDVGNPRRKHRVRRTREEILQALRELVAPLNRRVVRNDLRPPWPSYKAVARYFGSWQQGVREAIFENWAESAISESGRLSGEGLFEMFAKAPRQRWPTLSSDLQRTEDDTAAEPMPV